MEPSDKLARFEQAILPHLDAAYNLARWLTRNEHDAEDVVQEAYLRAFRFFEGFHGGQARAWLLAILRNRYYSAAGRNPATEFDEQAHSPSSGALDPERLVLEQDRRRRLRRAMEGLPLEFREALVLRELEGLSYREIADVADIPIGTVMSRLARLDYVDGRPAAALVYRRRQHVIHLFVWPEAGRPDSGPRALAAQGYNLVQWTRSGMAYWAASDLNAAEPQELARLVP